MKFQQIPSESIWGLPISISTFVTIVFNPIVQAQNSKLPSMARVTGMTQGDH